MDDQLLGGNSGAGLRAAFAGVRHFIKVQSDLMAQFPNAAQHFLRRRRGGIVEIRAEKNEPGAFHALLRFDLRQPQRLRKAVVYIVAQDHAAGVRLIIMIAGKGIAALTQQREQHSISCIGKIHTR